jgi:hypothetical protein
MTAAHGKNHHLAEGCTSQHEWINLFLSAR